MDTEGIQSKTSETIVKFRLPLELKQKAQEKAQAEDLTLSQVLRRFLREYIGEETEET